ncbi:adenosylcobinamide-GDP ribazoletransferase [Lachnoclostridium sp.]|uniref:adenosylcobinamide-GDP ribazoletransferase n=1 Tax=Lachnoclostridium sp. TaxID=2028282 RepID=UPI002898C686|nr:adenosylcobinamide-GDP ribazoletransferase [Lachnoclostridium sp.]
MKWLNSLWIAFSMYSKIRVPMKEWEESSMRYAICFFPMIGVVIGGVFFLTFQIGHLLPLGDILIAALLTSIPTLISGGIHMDGYCDTMDAISSYQPKERRLEILKDPHSGAFAIIRSGVYFLLYFGMVSVLTVKSCIMISLFFVVSRALSGLAVVQFKTAKTNGLVATFQQAAHKRKVTISMVIYLMIVIICMLFVSPVLTVIGMLTALFCFFSYKKLAYQLFGGTTGDLAGYFLVRCELMAGLAVVIMEGVFTYGAGHWW